MEVGQLHRQRAPPFFPSTITHRLGRSWDRLPAHSAGLHRTPRAVWGVCWSCAASYLTTTVSSHGRGVSHGVLVGPARSPAEETARHMTSAARHVTPARRRKRLVTHFLW